MQSRYWSQRHSIFSKYDEGIWMTDDAWFEVTPEPVAAKIAEHVSKAAPTSKTVLIDAFGGVGGNAIQFALSGRWERIFAVEKDPQKVKCAKHNAEIYGVNKKIYWIVGDIFEALNKRFKGMDKDAVIFGSPPWGGESPCSWFWISSSSFSTASEPFYGTNREFNQAQAIAMQKFSTSKL